MSTAAGLLAAMTRELRWRLLLAAAVAVLLAFAEGTGVLLLIPLLQSIGMSPTDSSSRGLSALVGRAFAAAGLQPTLLTVLMVFLCVSAAHVSLYAWHLLLNPRLQQQFEVALRKRLYSAIVRADWAFSTRYRMNDLVHAVTWEVDRSGTGVYQLLTVISGAIVSVVYIGIAWRLSAPLTLLVAVTGIGLLWIQGQRTRRTAERSEQYSAADREQFRLASDSLAGLKVAKSLGAEQRGAMRFAGLADARAHAYTTLLRSFALGKAGLDLSSALLVSGLLFVAVRWFALSGPGVLLIVFVFVRVVPRLVSIQEGMQLVVASLPAYRTVANLIEQFESEPDAAGGTTERRHVLRDVRLQDVSYTYRSDTRLALDRVSLVIPARRITAITGASGSGKTTLADVLIGLLRPTTGAVIIDGERLTDTDLTRWRRSIAYVTQDSFLLHDTIRANLQWANPQATEPQMWDALRRARAESFVRDRPEGLDAVVGDRGVRLSRGERQRLALARALLVHPDVLVLDEATSALDSINENEILAAIAGMAGRITIVTITHRLSAIRHADLIHVLDNGRLAESGTWTSLMAKSGVFASLVEAQTVEGSPTNQPGRDAAPKRAAI